MKQEEIQKVLDSLNEGLLGTRKEWQWDNARARTSEKGVPKKHGDRISHSKKNVPLSKAHKAKLSEVRQGQNPRKGTGAVYQEVTTNVTGSASELAEIFNYNASNIIIRAKKDKPVKYGRLKGLHFRIYN